MCTCGTQILVSRRNQGSWEKLMTPGLRQKCTDESKTSFYDKEHSMNGEDMPKDHRTYNT